MTLYAEVQRTTEAKIDQVIGNARLQVHPDEDALPYLQAVLKEVLHWHAVRVAGHIQCRSRRIRSECPY
jgi:hypothetical protein